MTKSAKKDVYQEVTNRIIEALENGCAPWVKPWNTEQQEGNGSMPYNAISGANYSGVNTILLWTAQMEAGHTSNTWLTFKQAKALGGSVRRGEKGTPIIYFQMLKRKDEKSGDEYMIPMLKQYTVFNVAQTEDIDHAKAKSPAPVDVGYTEALELAQRIGAEVKHGGDKAFFTSQADYIQMPPQAAFEDLEAWDSTLLHELTHWTGHNDRLNRELGNRFGSDKYAFEELVAEIGAAFLGAELGLKHEKLQHESYIASWLNVLKNDKKAIFKAAKLAQAASNLILDSAGKVKTLNSTQAA